ncbi:MAG TPA: hypothetical protein VN408_05740 [Actinoplanes sp.]|nr:hypothetical protein [Actinoplanes sp.]
MSSPHRLLLPVPAALLALSACTPATEATKPAAGAPAPAGTTGAATPTETEPETGTGAGADECPSAETLEGLVKLPTDWRFVKVECVQGWAAADPEGPNPGDGVYLFKKTGSTWKLHGEGSGYDCRDLGLDEAPFCVS